MNRLPKKRGITQVEEDKSLILRFTLLDLSLQKIQSQGTLVRILQSPDSENLCNGF